MKVIVESEGLNASDDYFKRVAGSVLHSLLLAGYQTPPAGVELEFACKAPTGFENPDAETVKVRHTRSQNPYHLTYLEQIGNALLKIGRPWRLCPCDQL